MSLIYPFIESHLKQRDTFEQVRDKLGFYALFCMGASLLASAVDVAIASSTLTGAHTSLIRSFPGPYSVSLELDALPGSYDVAANTEDWINFVAYFFFSASNQIGKRRASNERVALCAYLWLY